MMSDESLHAARTISKNDENVSVHFDQILCENLGVPFGTRVRDRGGRPSRAVVRPAQPDARGPRLVSPRPAASSQPLAHPIRSGTMPFESHSSSNDDLIYSDLSWRRGRPSTYSFRPPARSSRNDASCTQESAMRRRSCSNRSSSHLVCSTSHSAPSDDCASRRRRCRQQKHWRRTATTPARRGGGPAPTHAPPPQDGRPRAHPASARRSTRGAAGPRSWTGRRQAPRQRQGVGNGDRNRRPSPQAPDTLSGRLQKCHAAD